MRRYPREGVRTHHVVAARRWLREALSELERQTWDDEAETYVDGGNMYEARRAVERALDDLRRLAPEAPQ